MELINERIKKIRKMCKLSQEKFGERIGITKASISRIESGENNPSEQTIILICKEFEISYAWLTNGIEPMELQTDHSSMARIDNLMNGENEFAKNLFKAFAKLDSHEWELLEKIIKDVAKEL